MNKSRLREKIGTLIRLFPRPKQGDHYITNARNKWHVLAESRTGLDLLNTLTDWSLSVPFDNIREFREPDLLVLRAQILLLEGSASFVPFADVPDEIPKALKAKFEGQLTIAFSVPGHPRELQLPVISRQGLPSQQAADRIREVIGEKERLRRRGIFDISSMAAIHLPFSPVPYEERPIEVLKNNLAEVEQTFREDDHYALCEVRSHKINVSLHNEGTEYIEEASIELQIQRCNGLMVADEIPEPPRDHRSYPMPRLPAMGDDGYPDVETTEERISVFQELGNIKHRLPTNAFREPLRLVLLEEARQSTVKIQCTIRGKNLVDPRTQDLIIRVV